MPTGNRKGDGTGNRIKVSMEVQCPGLEWILSPVRVLMRDRHKGRQSSERGHTEAEAEAGVMQPPAKEPSEAGQDRKIPALEPLK
jgi:hypothetical protein